MAKKAFLIVSLFLLHAVAWSSADASSRNRFGLSSVTGRRNIHRREEASVETVAFTRRNLHSPSTSTVTTTTTTNNNSRRQEFPLLDSKDDPPASPPQRTITVSKQTFASGVAFLNGVADVFCFRMNGCYANMMTANSAKFAAALAEFKIGLALHFASVLLCYAIGSTLYRTLFHIYQNRHHPQPNVAARATASPLILLAFALSDYIFFSQSMGTKLVGHILPLALGFGLLNTASVDATGGTITFAMTGHLHKITQGIADWFFTADPRKRRFRSATRLSAHMWMFFMLGAVVGTVLSTMGKEQILMPASGFTMSYLLVGQLPFKTIMGINNLPLFTILGILFVGLLQLYDRSIPNFWDLISSMVSGSVSTAERSKPKVEISVNRWPQW